MWLTTDIKEYKWIKVQYWCSNLVTEDVSLWLELWFSAVGQSLIFHRRTVCQLHFTRIQFLSFLAETAVYRPWDQWPAARQMWRLHFHTIQSLCILDIQEGRRSPDSDGSIVWGTGQQTGHHRVPAHTVDCAGVTSQLCDGQLTAPVPDVNFVVWQERETTSSAVGWITLRCDEQHKTFF